jgi:hypothetical protein
VILIICEQLGGFPPSQTMCMFLNIVKVSYMLKESNNQFNMGVNSVVALIKFKWLKEILPAKISLDFGVIILMSSNPIYFLKLFTMAF